MVQEQEGGEGREGEAPEEQTPGPVEAGGHVVDPADDTKGWELVEGEDEEGEGDGGETPPEEPPVEPPPETPQQLPAEEPPAETPAE